MTETDIAIVGSGFSGLGMAIKLKEDGVEDFVVLERDQQVGGTWWANTYPGCGCDVPSHLYSFSFAPNPDWTRTYSKQPEIEAYLQRVADDFGVRRHIRLGTTVTGAALGRRRPALDRGDRQGRRQRPRARVGRRRALGAEHARHRGHRLLPGPHLPLRPLGPRLRPEGQAGRGHRHGRVGDPVRPHDRPRRRADARLPAHRAVDHAPLRPLDHAARAAPVPALPDPAEARARRRLQRPRAAGARLRQAAEADEGRGADRAQAHGAARSPTPSCAARWSRATRSAASGSSPRTSGIRRSGATTSSSSPTASPRSASTRSSRRRARRSRSTRSSSAPASTSPTCRSPSTSAVARAARSRTAGRAARAPTWAPTSPASRTCSCCSAPTPGSGTARWSTWPSPRSPTRWRRCARRAAAARRSSRSAPRPSRATTGRSTSGWATPCGAPAARAGTWTTRGATRRCGQTGRSPSAAAPLASTPRSTSSAPRPRAASPLPL